MIDKISNKYENENMAKAVLRSAGISLKQSIEISNFIKKKKVSDAIKIMEGVLKETGAIPFKRFTEGAGHKKGIGAGKYPKKAASAFINLLKSVEANAQNKGLSTTELVITSICANKAATQWHYGRKRRRRMKRAHVEIYVKEGKKQEKKSDRPKEVKKEEKLDTPKKTAQEKKPDKPKQENNQEVVKTKK